MVIKKEEMEREGRRMIHIGSVGVVSGGRVVVVAVVGSRASTHGAVHKWFLPRTSTRTIQDSHSQ